MYFSVILLYRANKDKKQVTTSCGHLFCNVCIIGALQSSHACPVCRTKDPSTIVIYDRLG